MKLIKIFLTLILITGLNFSASGQSFKGETAVAGGPPEQFLLHLLHKPQKLVLISK